MHRLSTHSLTYSPLCPSLGLLFLPLSLPPISEPISSSLLIPTTLSLSISTLLSPSISSPIPIPVPRPINLQPFLSNPLNITRYLSRPIERINRDICVFSPREIDEQVVVVSWDVSLGFMRGDQFGD